MSSCHASLKVRQVPQYVRRWLERRLEARLPVSWELSLWVQRPTPRKELDAWWESQKRERRLEKNRLKRVARKMRKAGMSERDMALVRNGGRIESDSY